MWRVPFLAVPQSCFEAPVNAALQAPIKKQEKKTIICVKYLRRQMRHCNGHSSMPDKQPRAFHSSSLDKEREEGSSFCAITFNNKMQGQALTQIEIHTECFCFIPLGQSSMGICKYFYLSICFQGHCTQSPLPNMSEKTAVNPSTVFFHSSVFHLHYAS